MNFQYFITQLTNARSIIPDVPLAELNPKFIEKLQEELNELQLALQQTSKIDPTELADCFIVICNCASYNQIDIVQTALIKATNDIDRKP